MLNQWSKSRKSLILLVCSVYSFLSNSALLGPSVYIGIFAQEFEISPNKASNLISYANLAFGFGASQGKTLPYSEVRLTIFARVSPSGACISQVWAPACDVGVAYWSESLSPGSPSTDHDRGLT